MSADDLSGRWQGIFNYPRDQPATGFVAILSDAGGALSGETVEPGLTGGEVAARIDGRRHHGTVSFAKLYDDNDGNYDTVTYQGTVATDGQEITGRWTIPGIWSGTFIMVREDGVEQQAELEAEAGLDASPGRRTLVTPPRLAETPFSAAAAP